MPIIVKDFTWTQSESRICINLPLKGTKATNLDILNSLNFIKISYSPFIFECWLHEKIKDEEGTAIVNNGIISLQFAKEEEVIWPCLFHPDFENKELVKQVREEALTFAGERARRLAAQKLNDIADNKKIAIKEQMKLEEQERSRIESIKENERKMATAEIEKFKERSKMVSIRKEENEIPALESGINFQAHFPLSKRDNAAHLTPAQKSIFEESTNTLEVSSSTVEANKDQAILPRASGNIQIKFTPRVFPTPSRESTDAVEREWLEKQTEARKLRSLPEDLTDLAENETNIDWLKEKASNYFKQENYQAAITVYSHAIKLFPKEPSLYSNRAACHFKIRNLIKCVEDCTRALDFLTPPVQANAVSRLKAHVRRGSAFCELELYAEGLLDYEAALKIEPDNKELIADAENIRKIIVGTPPEVDM